MWDNLAKSVVALNSAHRERPYQQLFHQPVKAVDCRYRRTCRGHPAVATTSPRTACRAEAQVAVSNIALVLILCCYARATWDGASWKMSGIEMMQLFAARNRILRCGQDPHGNNRRRLLLPRPRAVRTRSDVFGTCNDTMDPRARDAFIVNFIANAKMGSIGCRMPCGCKRTFLEGTPRCQTQSNLRVRS